MNCVKLTRGSMTGRRIVVWTLCLVACALLALVVSVLFYDSYHADSPRVTILDRSQWGIGSYTYNVVSNPIRGKRPGIAHCRVFRLGVFAVRDM